MSEERFEDTEAKEEDVEAHKRHSMARNVEATGEPGSEESDDVEAHKRHSMARNVEAADEPGSDESDDVEAHARRASHKQA
ncbi:MAG: hypothetical protein ACJ734_01875 [Gaiellaceae bacterium]